jgi:hypothetical protein
MSFPLRWLTIVAQAQALPALPVLLVIHRVFECDGRKQERYLTPRIWEQAGVEDETARRRAMRHLKKLPGLLILDRAPDPRYYYRIRKGPDWYIPEPSATPETEVVNSLPPGARTVDEFSYKLHGVLYQVGTGYEIYDDEG